MKKIYLIIFFIHLKLILFSYSNIDFILDLNFNSTPITYDFFKKGNIYTFNGFINFGFKIKNFITKISFEENYFNFSYNKVSGNFNNIFILVIFDYRILSFLGTKTSFGLLFHLSEFKDNNKVISYFMWGLNLKLNLYILIPKFKYLYFDLINDFEFYLNKINLPTINLNLRLNFVPYLNFISLYNEIGVKLWNYKFQSSFFSPIFIWKAGISLNLILPRNIYVLTSKIKQYNYKKDIKENNNEIKSTENLILNNNSENNNILDNFSTEVTNDNSIKTNQMILVENTDDLNILNENSVEETNQIYTKLKNSKENDFIEITGIIFDKEKVTNEKSLKIVNEIYKYLIDNKNTIIAISCYTDFANNPDTEIELSKKRSGFIRDYLVSKGINKERIKILASGRIYKNNILQEERIIDIKIIKK